MKTVTFEVRVRISNADDEAKAILDARYKLMDVPGALSVIQIDAVDKLDRREVPAL